MKGSSSLAYQVSKRIFDIMVSGVGLVLASPIMAVTAIMVRHNLGSPVIFSQDRAGKDGRVFCLYKFRTMREPNISIGLISDQDRLTDFGKKLRASSLDELPSLWNIFMGDMSLVGPRPLRVNYLDLYTSEQARRHEVKPGLTGLAQVSGRNSLSWEKRFTLDVTYVDNQSFKLDFQILMKTVDVVLSKRGVSAEDCVTMTAFTGSQDA